MMSYSSCSFNPITAESLLALSLLRQHRHETMINCEPRGSPDAVSNFLSRYQVQIPAAISDLTSTASDSKLNEYEPGDYDVVCGRGKGSYNRPGNKRFRTIVQEHIPKYLSSKTKLEKTMMLATIIERVREQNNGTARFIKFDKKSGTWVQISDHLAREKVGHAIREAIQSNKILSKTKSCSAKSSLKQAGEIKNTQCDIYTTAALDGASSVVSI